jgi:lipopolysaccharide transport system ATP-binding protein
MAKKAKKLFLFPSSLRGTKQSHSKEEFWALKDMNFEIERGDRVGIIGRNGAGKSTLLKILSRIVEPTTGSIKIKGRVASLLEVGTGFHPELTGRENIFLNGAILGMSRAEIRKHFDAIVDFAEIEKFLDTPVKRYSSGMYVRLAFAVAAHLEPEILIVDEVLAVGDSQFQKKCLGKMEDVSKNEGRTVLFVSHQMAAIINLCNKGILLSKGFLQMKGSIKEITDTYLNSSEFKSRISLGDRSDRQGSGDILFTKAEVRNKDLNIVDVIQTGDDVILYLYFTKRNSEPINSFHVAIAFENSFGQRITHLNNDITNQIFGIGENINSGIVKILVKRISIVRGLYSLVLYSEANGVLTDWVKNAFYIEIENGDFYGTGKTMPDNQGDFVLDYQFSLIENVV